MGGSPYDIGENVSAHVCDLNAEGDILRLSKRIPSDVRETLKANKSSVLAAITRDQMMREGGFLPLLPGEVYERQVFLDMHVFIMMEADFWNAWRESFRGGKSIAIKQLVSKARTPEMALLKAKEYVDFVTKKR